MPLVNKDQGPRTRDKGPKTSRLIYGIHAVRHTLIKSPEEALELWVKAGHHSAAVAKVLALARRQTLVVQEVPRKTLDRLVSRAPHQGVVLRRRLREPLDEKPGLVSVLGSRAGIPLVLVLDSIQDPQNLGACLRTADAAGVDAVILPFHRGVGFTETVYKVASGAAETVPVIPVRNLARALSQLKEAGIWLVGTIENAEQSLYEADLTLPTAIVMGAEGRGLRRLTREHCDVLVHIPMHGRVESLNVSVATGVCLYEAVRQRRKQT